MRLQRGPSNTLDSEALIVQGFKLDLTLVTFESGPRLAEYRDHTVIPHPSLSEIENK